MSSSIFHLPARVVTVRGYSVAFKCTLQISDHSKNVAGENIKPDSPLPQKRCPHRQTTISSKKRRNPLTDVRKEKCIGVSFVPVLAPQQGSPSTCQYPDSHNHFAVPWSDSPNRYRLISWLFAGPQGGLQNIPFHLTEISGIRHRWEYALQKLTIRLRLQTRAH
jgi:hypothetical protein